MPRSASVPEMEGAALSHAHLSLLHGHGLPTRCNLLIDAGQEVL